MLDIRREEGEGGGRQEGGINNTVFYILPKADLYYFLLIPSGIAKRRASVNLDQP